jgi:hypothetical protein
MLNLQQQAGSIEVGKCADFIVLDRDILALGDGGRPEKIAGRFTRRQRRRRGDGPQAPAFFAVPFVTARCWTSSSVF